MARANEGTARGKVWRWLLPGAAALAALAIVFLIITRVALDAVKRRALNTMDVIKSTCQKYDDYQLGITTKDLQAVVNKANIFASYTVREALEDEAVLRR